MAFASACHTKSNQCKPLDFSFLERLRQRIRRWQMNWRSRQQLLTLDPRQLKDVGITPWQALEEASKPFWKA